jgi:ABC-type bacteriocin/lantibiotic exporter with double-glycine peptidase domain
MRSKPYFAPPFAPLVPRADRSVRALPVPGYRQARGYTCGYACALMVTRYFRDDIDGRELYRALGTDRSGTRQTALVQALRARGVAVGLRYAVDFARLCGFIDGGKPVIAYRHAIHHWVVVYGYGTDPERVFVADPREGEPCEHPWPALARELRGFAMVCSGRRERPAPEVAPGGEVATRSALGQLRLGFER